MFRHTQIIFSILVFAGTCSLYAQASVELLREAKDYNYNGKYDSAISTLRKTVLSSATTSDSRLMAALNYELGEGYLNVGKCDSARWSVVRGIELVAADDTLLAQGYYQLAKSVGGCSNSWEESIEILRKSIKIRNSLFGDVSREISYDYTLMGYLMLFNGNYDSAFHYLERALAIRADKADFDQVELSVTYYYLGKVYERKGDLKNGLDFLQRALKIREKELSEVHPSTSNCLNDIGNVYKKYGNYERALDYFLRGLEIRKATLGKDHINVGASYYSIGTLYGNMFDHQRAIDFIEQGNLILNKKYGDKIPVLHTYYAYLGRLYHKTGNDERAQYFLSKARGLGERYLTENHPYLAIIYNILGQYYADNNDLDQQQRFHTKALNIYEEVGARTAAHAEVMVELGELFGKKGNHEMALGYFERALAIYKDRFGNKNPKIATLYQLYGDLQRNKGEVEDALDKYWSSLSAVSYEDSVSEKSLDETTFSHKLMALRSIHRLAMIHASAYRKSHDKAGLEQSINLYLIAIKLIDLIGTAYQQEDSRTQLAKDTKLVFDDAIAAVYEIAELTGERRYFEILYHFMEKSKSPILLSQIQARKAQLSLLLPDSMVVEERDMRIELSYYRDKLRSAEQANDSIKTVLFKDEIFYLENSYVQFRERLKATYPRYYRYSYESEVLPLNELQNNLSTDDVVVEYYEAERHIFMLGIAQEQFKLSSCRITPDFIAIVEGYERSLTDNDFIINEPAKADSLFVCTASYLYDSLLLPVTDRHTNQLTLVPDGMLSKLNFGTLLTRKPNAQDFKYSNLNYVLSSSLLRYVHSVTVNYNFKNRGGGGLFAGFAPSYEVSEYADLDSVKHPMTFQLLREGALPLPEAIAEVRQINDFFDGEIWLNEEASETNFKENARNYSIIHLSMHSLLNHSEPEFSELLFNRAYDSLNDGFLTIDEIYNLDLNAEMAVLSACSSGGGRTEVGEGPISFSRAFSYAGCPSVITSLWKLPDAVTREIMVAFYKNLESGLPKDEALRKAQLSYLQSTDDPLYQHPFFWGSFVVLGDSRPLTVHSGMDSYLMGILIIFFFLLALLTRKKLLFS